MTPEQTLAGATTRRFAPAQINGAPVEPARTLANPTAEMAVLAGVLADPGVYDVVGRFLRPEHFHDAGHGAAYRTIAALLDAGKGANVATLQHAFAHEPAIAAIGGTGFLSRVAGMGPQDAAEDHAHAVLDAHLRRRTVQAAERAMARVYSTERIEAINRDLVAEAEGAAVSQDEAARDMQAVMPDVIARLERIAKGEVVAYPTGYRDIDAALNGGMEPGQFIVLGARPGMGKTALALGIAERMALAGLPVLYSSLEMGDTELALRLLARRLDASPAALKKRSFLTPDTLARVSARTGDLAALPLVIDQKPAVSLTEIRMQARAVRKRFGRLGAIIVDHLGLVSAPRDIERRGLYEKTTAISNGLKATAKDMGCPVLALCQLNREVEKREDKRPLRSDLRDSGSIEQDADVIALLYRQDYYDTRNGTRYAGPDMDAAEAKREVTELHIAKHRDGALATINLRFVERSAWFYGATEDLR